MILSNVSTIFSAAVDDERIAKNPCKAGSVTRPKPDVRKITPLSIEQVPAVREQFPAR